jgi:hypothetical protein
MSTSGKIFAMRDSFLCSTIDTNGVETDISAGFNPAQSIGGFCCSSVDFIVQTVENGEGSLNGRGNCRDAHFGAHREGFGRHTDNILGFESSLQVDIQWLASWQPSCGLLWP